MRRKIRSYFRARKPKKAVNLIYHIGKGYAALRARAERLQSAFRRMKPDAREAVQRYLDHAERERERKGHNRQYAYDRTWANYHPVLRGSVPGWSRESVEYQ